MSKAKTLTSTPTELQAIQHFGECLFDWACNSVVCGKADDETLWILDCFDSGSRDRMCPFGCSCEESKIIRDLHLNRERYRGILQCRSFTARPPSLLRVDVWIQLEHPLKWNRAA